MKCAGNTAVLVSLKLIVVGRATKSVGKAGKIGCRRENEPWQDALAGQPVGTGQSHASGLQALGWAQSWDHSGECPSRNPGMRCEGSDRSALTPCPGSRHRQLQRLKRLYGSVCVVFWSRQKCSLSAKSTLLKCGQAAVKSLMLSSCCERLRPLSE